MTFYEQLKKHLSVKQHVLVQRDDGDYCIFSHFTDDDGDWRKSGWWKKEESAVIFIGDLSGYSKSEIEKYAKEEGWKFIKAFNIPTEQFKVGDKVLVSEDAKELCEAVEINNSGEIKSMSGKVCEIKDISGSDYEVYTPEKDDWYYFPHSVLSYPIETEDTAAQEAIALLEKNGYVISKK